jgi:hypothetical protein
VLPVISTRRDAIANVPVPGGILATVPPGAKLTAVVVHDDVVAQPHVAPDDGVAGQVEHHDAAGVVVGVVLVDVRVLRVLDLEAGDVAGDARCCGRSRCWHWPT